MLNNFESLTRHLAEDLFNRTESGDTLYIVDDYNVDFNMSDSFLNRFVDSIAYIDRIKTVKIFIQNKKNDIGSLFNVTSSTDEERLRETFEKKNNFIRSFKSHGQECIFAVYPKFNVKPPFHGRYWLSQTAGFIVDGSINTSEGKTVLVQKMDEENYQIICDLTSVIFDHRNIRVKYFDEEALTYAYKQELDYIMSRKSGVR